MKIWAVQFRLKSKMKNTANKSTGSRIGRKMTNLENPKVRIKSLKINPYLPPGQQLKKAREYMGFSRSAMARALDWNSANLKHYEDNTYNTGKTFTAVAFKYAKAMGIRELIFII